MGGDQREIRKKCWILEHARKTETSSRRVDISESLHRHYICGSERIRLVESQ